MGRALMRLHFITQHKKNKPNRVQDVKSEHSVSRSLPQSIWLKQLPSFNTSVVMNNSSPFRLYQIMLLNEI